MKVLVKSFMKRIFPYFTFSVLCTAERDVCVIVIFKKSGGPAPGPSDATPMLWSSKFLLQKLKLFDLLDYAKNLLKLL